jgi:hypothetical protein
VESSTSKRSRSPTRIRFRVSVFSTQYMVWVAFAAPLALGRIRPFVQSATLSATLLALNL